MAAHEALTSMDMAMFEDRVSRSVFLDDVAPSVTISTIRCALGQFGKVLEVRTLDCPLNPKLGPKRVLIEMATQREANHAIREIQEHPFIMMKGIPRPVIARAAEATMYPERPSKMRKTLPANGLGKNTDIRVKPSFCWVDRGDPDWNLVHKEKQLIKKHVMECEYLMQELRKEEEKLSKEQQDRAASFMEKFALVDACSKDKVVLQLNRYYGASAKGH